MTHTYVKDEVLRVDARQSICKSTLAKGEMRDRGIKGSCQHMIARGLTRWAVGFRRKAAKATTTKCHTSSHGPH
jgi:hypothetical protein